MKKVCVIGGGAAGLMAAYAAAENGHQVRLIEKNEKLGKKIYITGKGRCNFTNDVSPQEFLQNVVRGEKFLMGALYSFPPQKVIDFFEEWGMPVKIERGNRAFPVSDHASDVTKALAKACANVGVEIRLNEKVISITSDIITTSDIVDKRNGDCISDVITLPGVIGVQTDQSFYDCDEVIVATGGISYPSTGSTGDGYRFAEEKGLKIIPVKSALCGLNVEGDWYKSLQGLALKNVSMTAKYKNKTVYEDFGEMLFTHFGISGPIVLSLSSKINRLPLLDVQLFLDCKPALDEQTLDKRLLRDFEKYKNKKISNALCEVLPQKLISVILSFANIREDKNVNVLTKEERLCLVKTIKNIPVKIKSLRGIEEAIVTSGGVDLSEINPKTMECKRIKGLRFCGEVLDVDAFTGGFNLQIAFSTGYMAGKGIK